ncbi:hypothetical protein O0I10_007022 [Lichtheimia ornata]|uniref:Uncharacterized protein n=1 Tax=Lichtheimia ornata TaxID=688661 RepID=A0AAD7V3V2_9FUNG|nr:uncharacterized protein O0I10_007022 [Lichtheimia ornata]KAJ8657206.1 hypothetical protein O0I10_007022 [Lichtheimia ornata]
MRVNDCASPAQHAHHSTFLIRGDLVELRSNKEVSSKSSAQLILISTSSTPTLSSLPPILNCCPIQVQLPPTNDCPASTHHVNPTLVLIRLSLAEWQLHGVYTAFLSLYYNTRVS